MSAADVHSILYRGEDPLKQKFVPRNETKTTVTRHWPGKAPTAAGAAGAGAGPAGPDEFSSEDSADEGFEVKQKRMQHVLAEDRRLHRLAAAAAAATEAASAGPRRRREAVVIQSEKERRRQERGCESSEEEEAERGQDGEGEEEGEDVSDRQALRRQVLELRLEEELRLQRLDGQEDEEEEEESEYSDSSDEGPEDAERVLLHKPVFVPKAKRVTALEREEARKVQEEEERQRLQSQQQRKIESKEMLYAALAREESEQLSNSAVAQNALSAEAQEAEMPDDTDGVDPAQEYEDWKERELARIRRDKEEAEERSKFLEAVERRRQMTEEERREDDRALDKLQPKREVKYKYNFMQKYYHRGAFFQDLARSGEEPLYLRDYNAPVGEDALDKKQLPKVMQLRRGEFGRGGRVKHTHLVDADTSDPLHPWALNAKEPIGKKLAAKAGGLKGAYEFERPSAKKKGDGSVNPETHHAGGGV